MGQIAIEDNKTYGHIYDTKKDKMNNTKMAREKKKNGHLYPSFFSQVLEIITVSGSYT